MKKFLLSNLALLACGFLFTQMAIAQGTPEVLYYRFNGTGTSLPNLASSPPSGTATATLNGSISQGSSGTCGSTALVGSGTASSTDYVNTGWATDLTGSWTISFWTSGIGSSSTLFYIFGDAGASSFRCFTNGVAGANNWLLRGGGFPDVLVSGAATSSPHVTTFVRDSTAGQIYAYLDGALVTTVATTATGVTGTGPFKVCGYSSNVGLPANGLMDEFRFYKRALSASEVAKLVYTGNSNRTLNVSLCANQYVSPTGKYVWTTSGTYKDTLPNYVNCDSIITVNLTLKTPTSSTTALVACNSYKSPSGKYTWTTSGSYKDTIPNSQGCDSVMTINLTVNYSSTGTITPTACDTYMSPSGKYNWTASGTYMDTVPNNAGCDSIITVNLTINNSSTGSISPTACDSYMSPSGKYNWTVSGTYLDTVPNGEGCDSIITVNLTINNTSTGSVSPVVCNSYISPSGKYTWNTSGTYYDTLPNSTGCDSVITIGLTVNYTTTDSINPVVCVSYLSPGGKNYTVSGLYKDTIPNGAGCDSIITINLTVNNPTTSNISPVACFSYNSPSGKNTWTTSGNYTDTIPNNAGCDSIISITLTINTVNISVSQAGQTFTATATGAQYQWLNCNSSFAIIPGATAQAFSPTANGNYAVEVTENACVDTSICYAITNVGIKDIAAGAGILVYPNPTNGEVIITFNEPVNNAVVKIVSVNGQTVLQFTGEPGEKLQFDMSSHPAGIYFVEVIQSDKTYRNTLVKY